MQQELLYMVCYFLMFREPLCVPVFRETEASDPFIYEVSGASEFE